MAINREKVEAAAIKLLQAGKLDKAVLELKKLVEDDKNDVRTLLKLGDTFVKMGNKREAIDSYERAATIYTEQGFFLKAVAVFKQVLRVDANIPELHLKLAELYQQLGLQSDAMTHYQAVAAAYEQAGRAREALDMIKRMVELDPDNLALRIRLGEAYVKEDMAAEAVQELRRALTFLKTQGRFDDYIRVGEKLVSYDASALDVARELASIYMQRKQPSQALTKLQLCFRAEPRNIELLTLIAQAFLEMREVPKTISVYKEIARIHGAEGDKAQARTMWEKVHGLAPTDEEAKEALGIAVVRPAAPAPGAPAAPKPAPPRASPEVELLQRLLTETDVYVKYGLKDKAIEHLDKVFAVRADFIPALEKLKALQQGSRGRGHLEALQRLVAAAAAQGHARLKVWREELATVEAQALLEEDEDQDEDLIIDDDGVSFDDDSGVMQLDNNSSGVYSLDRSEVDQAPMGAASSKTSPTATPTPSASPLAHASATPPSTPKPPDPKPPAPAAASPAAAAPSTAVTPIGSAAITSWDNDPATVGFSEELTEAEYFLRRGMLDKAKELLLTVQEDAPDSLRVSWMLERLAAREAGEPEPPPPWERPSGHIFSTPLSDPIPELEPMSVKEVFSEIRSNVSDGSTDDDGAKHYELGVAYREMGLLDDAVTELTMAARASSHAVDARFIIGMIRVGQGKRDAALAAFDEALTHGRITAIQRGAVNYERGLVLEDLKRESEALEAYRAARSAGHGAVDLELRIKGLSERLGDGNGRASGGGSAPAARGPKTIDYA